MPSLSPKPRVALALLFIALALAIALKTHRLHHFSSSISLHPSLSAARYSTKKCISAEASPNVLVAGTTSTGHRAGAKADDLALVAILLRRANTGANK